MNGNRIKGLILIVISIIIFSFRFIYDSPIRICHGILGSIDLTGNCGLIKTMEFLVYIVSALMFIYGLYLFILSEVQKLKHKEEDDYSLTDIMWFVGVIIAILLVISIVVILYVYFRN